VVWQANGRLSVENFDRENVDELIKSQSGQYFPRQKFAPYGKYYIRQYLFLYGNM